MHRVKQETRRMWPLRAICGAIVVGILLAGGVLPTRAALTSGCPSHVYLGNNPDGTDAPDWSENAQGIANDGQHWFFTNKERLFKYDANWRPINGDDIGKLGSVGFPPVLAAMGINHFGDPDYYAGYVFVPFEGDRRAVIAAFRASDLAFVDWVDVFDFQPKAGWVAINSTEQMLYTSTDRLVAGTPLLRYTVDVSKIENGIAGDFLTPTTPVAVLDADGTAVSGQFIYMQGGVFTPWGDLYLSVGKAADSPSATRGGLHLFRRTTNGSAFQLIESSVNVSGHVGDGVFAYEYHPGSTGLGEEPEGIDWWNRDNVPNSRYQGQLHAILLDNQVGDDQIWLKHYRVDYFCAGDPSYGWGYVWANAPTAAAYTPALAYQFNSTGAANTITRTATGAYIVTFPGLDANGGTVLVTAYGSSNATCKVAYWVGTAVATAVHTRCFSSRGEPVDTFFTASFIHPHPTAVSKPMAYVWANAPTKTNYTPSLTYQFNSTGAVNTITRTSTGHYTVRLPGLGAWAGHVQVTAYGSGSGRCRTSGMSPSGSDQLVLVLCVNNVGSVVDSQFVMSYARGTSLVGFDFNDAGAEGFYPTTGYALGNEATTASYIPLQNYQYNTIGSTATITRLGVGNYQVRFPGQDLATGHVQVTAYGWYGSGSTYCNVRYWNPTDGVRLQCYDTTGAPADSYYTVTFLNALVRIN